jgi:adenosylmethionine-8-amino-7-oxononanoate aminotransferase
VSKASIDLLLSRDWDAQVQRLEAGLRAGLAPCSDLDGVRDVRVLGGIGVVETDEPVDVAALQREFVERGVWIRPFGRLVYVMPPYVTSSEQLDQLTRAIVDVLASA